MQRSLSSQLAGSRPLPRPHVLDAERGGEVGVVGHAKPLGHRLAVQDQVEGLVPVGVFNPPHRHAVHVIGDLLLAPVQPVNVIIVRQPPGCHPSAIAGWSPPRGRDRRPGQGGRRGGGRETERAAGPGAGAAGPGAGTPGPATVLQRRRDCRLGRDPGPAPAGGPHLRPRRQPLCHKLPRQFPS